VRIPLDYYRILGLPIQATADQLQQAHRDRALQLPRREYSDAAIASRKKLLDQAYTALSNPDHRQTYDARFLAKTYDLPSDSARSPAGTDPLPESDLDPHAPHIDIPDDQFVGALLLLQELGEYELVLKLGRPFLTSGNASLKGGQYGDPRIVYSDIVLTVALACLELGREQWQQGQHENAAEALETGEKLLLREGLFATVRGEIQADLFKLRPYRVLELLALPDDRTEERYRGMQLLQDMLQERGGIDGTGNDYSGLSIDDFLRFIQQLRAYLTAAEQQVLFEEESRRPSAVATYLAVYALMARGFAEHQPALIRRARTLLVKLATRQDVHLEQSVCALLLGQTEEASRSLEKSQEYEPIAFIREHSKGSPDLLPGLCLYAERWLQSEVFPHFRDLARQKNWLKDYFADEQVQIYLEELPHAPEQEQGWSSLEQQGAAHAATAEDSTAAMAGDRRSQATIPSSGTQPIRIFSREGGGGSEAAASLLGTASTNASLLSATATLTADPRMNGMGSAMPEAERMSPMPLEPGAEGNSPSADRARQRLDRMRGEGGKKRPSPRPAATSPQRGDRPSKPPRQAAVRWMLPLVILAAMIGLGLAIAWMARNWQRFQPAPAEEQPLVQLDVPLVELPPPTPTAAATLSNDAAQKILEKWLSAKSEAMGPKYEIGNLSEVLTDPSLTEWKASADAEKQANTHRQYKHEVKVTAVEQEKPASNEARVTAEVSESTEYYEGKELKNSDSSPGLRVQYRLVRQNNQWRIRDWEILP